MTEPADAARVKTVAADPLHSLYHEAVRAMEFWESPEFQRLVMRALDHKNPRVRETAARCLLWEQPVAAEKRLLELASEADEDVAIAALDTLIYCSSREILLELDSLRNNGPQSLRDCYENTFDHVQGDFILAMPGQATEPDEKAYLLAWLKPVRHLLKKRRKKPRKTYKKSRNEVEIEKPEITARSIMDDLSDVDGMWYQKKNRYYGVAWAAFNNEDRKLLKSFFEQHSDAWVRDLGTRAFSAWQDVDAILSNLYDRDFSVLKTSAYCSRFLEPNLEIAMRLRELIEDPNVMNNFAKEALESYVYHARNGETYDWLLDLSKHDSRPSIRYAAVSELDSAETRSRIKELIPILEEPPANEWKVHCSILRACERSWLSQSTIEHLMSIDNLFLQTEIASSVVGA
jgi:hypothetical protein